MSKFKTRVKKGRIIDGIINIDKPLGFSSNKALQKVKYLLQAQKAGHTGALDPLASGVLPLCFGQATKISSFLLDSDKRYQADLQLGSVTNTGDKEGEIIKTFPLPDLDRETIDKVLNTFLGEQSQVPPMYSAIKFQGQPLYKLARKGQEVERKARLIKIYHLSVLDYSQEHLRIDVKCSKGTYIRTLAEDIGQKLGCGAHLSALRRTEAGPFDLSTAFELQQIEQAIEEQRLEDILLPADIALQDYPMITIDEIQTSDIKFGRKIKLTNIQVEGLNFDVYTQLQHSKPQYRIYNREKVFLGLGDLTLESTSKNGNSVIKTNHYEDIVNAQVCLNPRRMFL